jgi:hypothetical protein
MARSKASAPSRSPSPSRAITRDRSRENASSGNGLDRGNANPLNAPKASDPPAGHTSVMATHDQPALGRALSVFAAVKRQFDRAQVRAPSQPLGPARLRAVASAGAG